MQWSKLRALFLERLAPELQGRLDAHAAAYKSGGRTWLSFDGAEIACVQAPGFTRQVLRHSTCACLHDGQTLELGDAMFELLHAPIEEALASRNPLLNALAVLDKRMGKRRVQVLAGQAEPLPSFHAVLLSARLVAAGQPALPIVCEHCGTLLHHHWPTRPTSPAWPAGGAA
jgi:hypothetical protein